MTFRRRLHPLLLILVTALGGLGLAAPAAAAPVGAGPAARVRTAAAPADKLAVLASFTQVNLTSYQAWLAARANPAPWEEYRFTWSTDWCTASPDNPLGFDFRLSCARHDFGYANYKAVGRFAANKPRLDDAFYADLKRRCAAYNAVVRPACLSLAWTYYQAVRVFGAVVVSQADLDRAARMRAAALRDLARHG